MNCSLFACTLLAGLLAACGPKSNLLDPPPPPVVQNKFTLSESWRQSRLRFNGARLQPARYGNLLAVQNGEDKIALLNLTTGKEYWQKSLLQLGRRRYRGLDGQLIAVGTVKGEVLAFDHSGKPLWTYRFFYRAWLYGWRI